MAVHIEQEYSQTTFLSQDGLDWLSSIDCQIGEAFLIKLMGELDTIKINKKKSQSDMQGRPLAALMTFTYSVSTIHKRLFIFKFLLVCNILLMLFFHCFKQCFEIVGKLGQGSFGEVSEEAIFCGFN